MIILIDGYNILKQLYSGDLVSEHERNQFIALLGRYARRKKHKLVVVFDGGPYEWPHKERQHGIEVIFSGVNETADEYIIEYLEKKKNSDLLLVTSDHELNRYANRLNIPSIDSQSFYGLAQEALAKTTEAPIDVRGDVVKLTERTDEELDTLMLEASQEIELKNEDIARQVHMDRKKMSKHDRKLWAKLKKL